MMILAAGGYVSPEAEAELTAALQLDPLNGTATLLCRADVRCRLGRPDRAFALLGAAAGPLGSPTDPWVAPIRGADRRGRRRGRGDHATRCRPMPGAPGPTAEDMAAAADMTPEERQAMIEGMVAQLSDRLATEGGPAEDWARLIGAYGVLGETDRGAGDLDRGAGALCRAADADLARPAAGGGGGRGGPVSVRDGIEDFAAALPRAGRIAGLDLGDKTIGVAVSDRAGRSPRPLQTIRRVKFTVDAAELLALLAARGDRRAWCWACR